MACTGTQLGLIQANTQRCVGLRIATISDSLIAACGAHKVVSFCGADPPPGSVRFWRGRRPVSSPPSYSAHNMTPSPWDEAMQLA
eukprot:10915590-Alexandrium_andersonii.AAC.1